MFVHNVKIFPVRHRRVGTFLAADPLHGGQETEWNIETYRMQARGVKIIRGNAKNPLGGADRLAIKSELDGEPRMLPEAIAFLWRSGEVPAPALPEILRTFGPEMSRPRDFEPRLGRDGGRRWPWVAVVTLGLVLALLGAAAALYMAKRRFPPGSPHRVHRADHRTMAKYVDAAWRVGEHGRGHPGPGPGPAAAGLPAPGGPV